ncbi:MAG: glycosyltransferase [Nocardioides sp.]
MFTKRSHGDRAGADVGSSWAVSESFYPAVDGTTTTVRAVADRLVDTDHHVLGVAPGPGLASYRGCRVARIGKPGRCEQVLVALADFGADYWRTTMARRAELGVEAPVWTPGVDTRTFSPTLRDPGIRSNWARHGEVLVGYVGGLRNRHDVRRLAELGSVRGSRLVVVGDGPQRRWLETQLPTARFLGPLDTGALATTLANLDVLVHPGFAETCCHALREAAASGVPVVAPAAGGATDVVRPMETGLLHDPRDPRGLVRALDAVVADQQRDLLGEHGRILAEWRSWEDAVDELVTDHYLPLVETSRAARTPQPPRPSRAATSRRRPDAPWTAGGRCRARRSGGRRSPR